MRFSTLGAIRRGTRPPANRRTIHQLSSVLVASSIEATPISADAEYWVTLARRLLQRGSLPLVPADDFVTVPRPDEETVASLFLPTDWSPEDLDLDPRYESRFFADAIERYPHEAGFLLPQAPLECLVSSNERTTRWIDFVYAPPVGRITAMEIDGRQHRRQRAVDLQRDNALRKERVDVARVDSQDGSLDSAPLFGVLGSSPVDEADPSGGQALRSALSAARLAYAIVEAVALGHFDEAKCWRIEVEGVGPDLSLFSRTLDVLAALDEVWQTGVMPMCIRIGVNDDWSWNNEFVSERSEGTRVLRTAVDWAPTWAALPSPVDVDVVVRGVPLPVHAGWDEQRSSSRRVVDSSPDAQPRLEHALATIAAYVYGIESFRPGQVRALRRILAGGDALVLLPTGSGKSLIYQLAMLLRPGTTVIVDPIKALIDDQHRRFADEGIDRVAAIHSGKAPTQAERDVIQDGIRTSSAIVALVSPERLQIKSFREALQVAAREGSVGLAVIDEAHCVSEWGHDFRTSYLRLARSLRRFGADRDGVPPPLLGLTGTASPAVLRDVLTELGIDSADPEALQRPEVNDRPNLRYEIRSGAEGQTFAMLSEALLSRVPNVLGVERSDLARLDGPDTVCGVVFVPWAEGHYGVDRTRDEILKACTASGLPRPKVLTYSGRMKDAARADTAAAFRRDDATILVATKAFGMGIDKPNIRWTVHVGIPSSIEGFAQEAGRAGRDGRRAHCMIVSGHPAERHVLRYFDSSISPNDRRASFARTTGLGDVGRQLYFLYNSFPAGKHQNDDSPTAAALRRAWSIGEERQAQRVHRSILDLGGAPGAIVSMPLVPVEVDEFLQSVHVDRERVRGEVRMLVDKALHRLSIVGVIDDLTVDYGADTVTLQLAPYSADTIDRTTLAFADATVPGRHGHHVRTIQSAPDDLTERVDHHLDYVVRLIYEVIEPARLNALREMWRLTLNNPTDETIRGTISAYLGGGPTSLLLDELVMAEQVDMTEALGRLESTARGDEFDWVGAAARLLEAYPGHPLLLYVRAGGEAFTPQGTLDGFAQQLDALVRSFDEYRIDEDQRSTTFRAMSDVLRNARSGTRVGWLAALWRTWFAHGVSPHALDSAAERVLTTPDQHVPEELEAALSYRIQRLHHDDPLSALLTSSEQP